MVLLLLITPLITLMSMWLIGNKKAMHIINIAGASLMLILGILLSVNVYNAGSISADFIVNFYIDSLNVIILNIVLVIGLLVSIYSIGYIDVEEKHGVFDLKRIRLYYTLVNCFIFTMIVCLTAGNMGIMWIGIEATTLSSAFLVGFNNDKKSTEAAWKYVIICSVGIALAFLGVIFLHLSSVEIVKGTKLELSWPYLMQHAAQLPASTLRLSFIFILAGFGTKAGLAPMHTWLPDAHSQAPSPISALLSGVLLNSAMYGIMRELAIVNRAMGSDFAQWLLIGTGVLSIFIAAFLIIVQKDYKRLLAYSSIEHMGIISFGLAIFSPAAVFASLLHMINHSLTKSMLFLSAGNVYLKTGTKEIGKLRGLIKVMPLTATVFLLGAFAITGMPPFSIFFSELGILTAAFAKLPLWLPILIIALLALVFAGFAANLFKIFYGEPAPNEMSRGEINKAGVAATLILLVLITVGGVFIPGELIKLINDAQRIIIGG